MGPTAMLLGWACACHLLLAACACKLWLRHTLRCCAGVAGGAPGRRAAQPCASGRACTAAGGGPSDGPDWHACCSLSAQRHRQGEGAAMDGGVHSLPVRNERAVGECRHLAVHSTVRSTNRRYFLACLAGLPCTGVLSAWMRHVLQLQLEMVCAGLSWCGLEPHLLCCGPRVDAILRPDGTAGPTQDAICQHAAQQRRPCKAPWQFAGATVAVAAHTRAYAQPADDVLVSGATGARMR